MSYEYKHLFIDASPKSNVAAQAEFSATLNDLGLNGFELVFTTSLPAETSTNVSAVKLFMIFKKTIR